MLEEAGRRTDPDSALTDLKNELDGIKVRGRAVERREVAEGARASGGLWQDEGQACTRALGTPGSIRKRGSSALESKP